jgi:hypothetical protein
MIPWPQQNRSTDQLQPCGTALTAAEDRAGPDNDEGEKAEPLNIC